MKREDIRLSSGVPGLDSVLGGGWPSNRLYLLQGDPGAGKTTLGMQFLLEGAKHGERGLYVTLSETRDEIEAVVASHGWSLDNIDIFELTAIEQRLQLDSENTLFHASEVELREIVQSVFDEIDRVKPARVVFDSLSELRLLAQEPLRFRRQVLAFKQHFAGRQCTVILTDDRSSTEHQTELQSVAHGVLEMEQVTPDYGAAQRRLRVCKLRGVSYRGGYHDFAIAKGGITVFPRLVAGEHPRDFQRHQLQSGVTELDRLLGGGLTRGTSTLVVGPAGIGKSSLMLKFAVAAAERGEKAALFLFDETVGTLLYRAEQLGMNIRKHVDSGLISLRAVYAGELSPGHFSHLVQAPVEKDKVSFVGIDSLNGYLNAMPEEHFLSIQMHELLSFLNQRGVVSMVVMAQHGMLGGMQSPVDVSYLADSVILLRFFEAAGAVRKAISVVKNRTSDHEDTIREFDLRSGAPGIVIGEPLSAFRGIFTGVPVFSGGAQELLVAAEANKA